MGLRFQSQLQVSNLPDEALENQFEVIMPKIDCINAWNSVSTGLSGIFSTSTLTSYQPIVEEINFGVRNFKTNNRRVRTGWCNVPEDIEQYKDVSITMFCSAGMLTQYYLAAWKSLMFDSDGEYYNPMQFYKKNIEVFFYGPGNVGIEAAATAHYTLQGCFPYSQENFKLKYASEPQRLRITQTFKVDKIVFDTTTAKSSIIQELATSPLSILDNVTTSLTNSANGAYNVADVYK